MQLKAIAIALMGVSVAVEASVLRGRDSVDIGLVSRQNRFGGGNNGGNNNGGNNGGNNNAAAAAAAAKASQSAAASKTGNNNNANNNAASGNNNNNNNAALTLNPQALQTGSQQDGSQGAEAGQAKSQTDNTNFINFCVGKTLTNGLQQKQGSCNGIPMGQMPASTNMVSTVIVNPLPNNPPAANQDFNVTVQIANMQLGTFTNPDSTYYAAPQQLSSGGDVIGHTHITIQDMGSSQNPTTPPDASKFAFFKGINDAGNGQGKLTTAVTGGLPAGNYRICTMAGSSNHQPVLMPVAQRGAQDDCMRLTIAAASNNNNGGNKNKGN